MLDLLIEVKPYDTRLVVVGIAALGAAFLPRLITQRAISFPLIYLVLGIGIFLLPIPGVEAHHPNDQIEVAERLTELGVIVALTGVGLKIDRPFSWRRWSATWRLLAITMPLTIALAALLGYWAIGLAPAAAMLFGAVLAPTDPVLAADVQSGEPDVGGEQQDTQEYGEDEVRFSLTSEAGLNDGLAFPFTNAAIAMVVAGTDVSEWLLDWFLVAFLMKVAIGVAVGWVLGWLLGKLLFRLPAPGGEGSLAQSTEGLFALAITLVVYGATELVQGYGFLGVFVAALTLREHERTHEHHQVLHDFADQAERFIMALIVILLGGWIVGGVLAPLTWQMVLVGLALVFVVRPALGMLSFIGHHCGAPERSIISFFGIRGIGSLYYLSHAIAEEEFPQEESLWALVGFTVVLSMVVHGLSTTPVMTRFERWREERQRQAEEAGAPA